MISGYKVLNKSTAIFIVITSMNKPLVKLYSTNCHAPVNVKYPSTD